MPFLTSAATAIAGAITGISTWLASAPLAAAALQVGFGIAAKYIAARLQPKPKVQATQLETRYGEDLARSVILGTTATAGHHIYRNAFGKGNRVIQDVYVLSHFRATGISRMRFEGEWRTISGTDDPNYPGRGKRLQTPGGKADIWVKFYPGTMDQAADPQLIARSNPAGRWTADHRLAGVAYAVVTFRMDQEHMTSPYAPLFEVIGAPLYDWRKDTSVGGSGAHRWNNQATWEYTDNPVLMAYALERGIFNGTELMVGKKVPSSRLPLSEWTVAANICDELVAGKKRYRAALIAVAGQGSTHAGNMEPLLEAVAASWFEGAAGEYPIAGANQAVAATFTDADLYAEKDSRFSRFRPRDQLVNFVAGTFPDPEQFYETRAFAARSDADALAEDGERLAVSIPYEAVPYPECVDRLADIALRASRYQANGEVCIHPRFLTLKPGQWVAWNSVRHGNRTYQVVSKRLGPIGPDAPRAVYLTLQEVGDGIFDPTAFTTASPVVVLPGAGDYQTELVGYALTPIIVETDTGAKRPAIRATWDAPDEDVTIVGVDFEYRPTAEPTAILTDSESADTEFKILEGGIVSLSGYQVRYRLRAAPFRTIPWTAWVPVTTLDARLGSADLLPIAFDALADEVNDFFEGVTTDIGSVSRGVREVGLTVREVRRRVSQRAIDQIEVDWGAYASITQVRRDLSSVTGQAQAYALEQVTLATSPTSALGQRLTEIEADLGDVATVGVIDAINVRLDDTEEGVESVAQRVTTIENLVVVGGDVNIIEAFDTRITTTEAGVELLGTTQRAMRTALRRTAVDAMDQDAQNFLNTLEGLQATANVYTQMDTVTRAQGQTLTLYGAAITAVQTSLSDKIGSNAFAQLESEVTSIGDELTLTADALTAVEAELDNKAATSALNALSATVTTQGGTLATQGAAITQIQGVLPGLASTTALSALDVRLTSAEGTITSQGSLISGLTTALDGKASTTALNALDTRVTSVEGSIVSVSSAVISLQNTINDSTTGLASKASATALNALDTRVTSTEGVNAAQASTIASQGSAITSLQNTINDSTTGLASKASASALSTLDTRVTSTEGVNAAQASTITSQGSAITSLQNTVGDPSTGLATRASASALTALDTRVTSVEGVNTSQASSLTALNSLVNDVSAGTLFRAQTYASPGDGWARIGLEARAGIGEMFGYSRIFLDAKSDGSSRIVIDSQSTFFLAGGEFVALFEEGGVRFNRVYVKELTADNLAANAVSDADANYVSTLIQINTTAKVLNSVTIANPTGAAVSIQANCYVDPPETTGTYAVVISLFRNNVQLRLTSHVNPANTSRSTSLIVDFRDETAGVGTHTYQMRGSTTSAGADVENSFMQALVLKR